MMFDGVALLAVTPAADLDAHAALDAVLRATPVVRLPDGDLARPTLAVGFPATVPGRDGPLTVRHLRTLAPSGPGDQEGHEGGGGTTGAAGGEDVGDAPPALDGLRGGTAAGPWHVREVAVVPPVAAAGLRGVRPLPGGRTHLATAGRGTTACGRLPVTGTPAGVATIDCGRCLRTEVVASRHDRQLTAHRRLHALADPLVAGAVDRLWTRHAHRSAAELPATVDAALGALLLDLPGAPDPETVLREVRRGRHLVSPSARAWAAGTARRRLRRGLPPLVERHPTELDHELGGLLRLGADLLEPTELAALLIETQQRHGPARALEAPTLRLVQGLGDDAPEPLRTWARRHAVAAALSGAGR